MGPCSKKTVPESLKIKIRSICHDIIYNVSDGKIKPSKHVLLGLSMKSLTSSKKVLNILNKYGHSISYTVAEELETELTYSAYERNNIIPPGITPRNDLFTSVAFDNYDRFVETLSGKDTLHDTVGIIYQFLPKPTAVLELQSPTVGFRPPVAELLTSQTESQPPENETHFRIAEFQPPITEVQLTGFQSPVTESQPTVVGFRTSTTEYQAPVTQSQGTELQPLTSEFQTSLTEFQPPITELQPYFTELQIPVTGSQSQVTVSQPLSTGSQPQSTESQTPARKRRRFLEVQTHVQPYHKLTNVKISLLPLSDIIKEIDLNVLHRNNAIIKVLIWLFALHNNANTPMWNGFNCKFTKDKSDVQIIDYLPQIPLSPTSFSVTRQTLINCLKIADECGQNYIVVTYDLAIAKMALQIQVTESPKFDKIFINLGGFHINIAFFKAIGKFLEGSRVGNILIQSEVLASGSINGFLDAKHYNRCSRIHPIMASALQLLHFETFLTKSKFDMPAFFELYFKDIIADDQTDPPEMIPLAKAILDEYYNYIEDTVKGEHGKTAQYYMMYVNFIHLYFRFVRSIKTCNLDLYIDCLYQYANLFFYFNQPNYARYILKNLTDLINMKNNNP